MDHSSTSKALIYHQYARLYDCLHSDYNYAGQVDQLLALLAAYEIKEGAHILEAACGTGNYLRYFQDHYTVSGFDNSPEMLALAKKKVLNGQFWLDDLQSFSSPAQPDAILCLCSAIAYLPDEQALIKTLKRMNTVISSGGVLILRPWLTPAQAKPGLRWQDRYEDEALRVHRHAFLERREHVSILDFHFSIHEQDKPPVKFVDRHELTLFSDDQIRHGLNNAGFTSQKVDAPLFGQYLWVAHKH